MEHVPAGPPRNEEARAAVDESHAGEGGLVGCGEGRGRGGGGGTGRCFKDYQQLRPAEDEYTLLNQLARLLHRRCARTNVFSSVSSIKMVKFVFEYTHTHTYTHHARTHTHTRLID